MQIMLNGETHQAREGELVSDLVGRLAGSEQAPGVAVALNEEVLAREAWSERRLADGDRVEILGIVGGG